MIPMITPPPRQDKDITGHVWQEWFRQLREWLMANYPANYFVEVARGNVLNTSIEHISGYNATNTAGATNDVWYAGGTLTWLQAAVQMDVVSTSANDTAAGTNARSIYIEGLDSNFDLSTETLALNGVGTVTSVNSYIRINKVSVISVGTYGESNAGDITIRVTGGGAIQGIIETARSVTQKSHYTVPNNYTACINRTSLEVEAGKTARISMYKRKNADDVTTPFYPRQLVHTWVGVVGTFEEHADTFFLFPAKTDIWMRVTPGGNNTLVHGDYDLVLTKIA